MRDFVKTAIRISRNATRRLPSDEDTVANNGDVLSGCCVEAGSYNSSNRLLERQVIGVIGSVNSSAESCTTLVGVRKQKLNDKTPHLMIMSTIYENTNDISEWETKSEPELVEYDVNIKRDQKCMKTRNKSTSAIEMMKYLGGLEEQFLGASSVDNLYENGRLFSKLTECDSRSINTTDSDLSINRFQYKPKKPKRSMKFDRDVGMFVPGTSVENVNDRFRDFHRELNVIMDAKNNVILPDEELDAFIEREKNKYSGEVPKGGGLHLSQTEIERLRGSEDLIKCSNLDLSFKLDVKYLLANGRSTLEGDLKKTESSKSLANKYRSNNDRIVGSTPLKRLSPTLTVRTIKNEVLNERKSGITTVLQSNMNDISDSTNDNETEMIPTTIKASAIEIESESSIPYIEPKYRNYLPPPPVNTNSFARRIGLFRKFLKNAGARLFPKQKSPQIPQRTTSLQVRKRKDFISRNNTPSDKDGHL